jgi:hypothetical protein
VTFEISVEELKFYNSELNYVAELGNFKFSLELIQVRITKSVLS